MVERDMQRFRIRMVREHLHILWLGGLSALFLLLFLFAGGDVIFRIGPFGRWLGSLSFMSVLLGLTATTIWIKRSQLTPSALAVAIERYFPELDNHLVNFVQFSKAQGASPFVDAYLKHDAPELTQLDPMRMRDRRKQRIYQSCLAGSLLVLLFPMVVFGHGWTVALWRVLNPLSDVGPVTRTRIVAVQPGDVELSQGSSIALEVDVQGVRGHAVSVEMAPDDGSATRYTLGTLENGEPRSFIHEIARVNTPFRYRFHAGDAVPSDWFEVIPLPLPALSRLQAVVRPPSYTGESTQRVNFLDDERPSIMAGSEVRMRAVCTVFMTNINLTLPGDREIAMKPDEENPFYEARFRIDSPGVMKVIGNDVFGRALDASIRYTFVADTPPEIEILEPTGRVLLPPGENPTIRFRVKDDFGLSAVRLERVSTDDASLSEQVETWDPNGARSLEKGWRGTLEPRNRTLTYRVVATDIAGDGQSSYSDLIVFNVPSAEEHTAATERLEQRARDQLARIIALQETNLETSRQLREKADVSDPSDWLACYTQQTEVRSLTRSLLQHPIRPLGAKEENIRSLYINEMILAIDALERIPQLAAGESDRQMRTAIDFQETILADLRAATEELETALLGRRQTAIMALLRAMIEGQSSVIERLEAEPAEEMFRRLSRRQDDLSDDLATFVSACNREAMSSAGSDAAYAHLLEQIVEETRERRIRDDMLLAADHLEQQQSTVALRHGKQAQESLEHLLAMLDTVSVPDEAPLPDVIHEALQSAYDKLDSLIDTHTKLQESMDAIRGARAEDDEAFDTFLRAFEETLADSKETLMEIPVDLHVFMDLNVANELVEDVFSIFQEIEQDLASKTAGAENVEEIAFAKNLNAIEKMREMQDRVDPREMWIEETPQDTAIMTEAIDREQMPEDGIALGALAAQADDLISDLMEETDEHAEASMDSASTHANPDFEATGWSVLEGDITSFGAQGQSGGNTPDHKEQDGRSNVGREGMASGETAAGSGTISEGDENIQERRTEDPTQSGEVQMEGDANARATGGGKLDGAGAADEFGMEGGVRRMDSSQEGSEDGMAALMEIDPEAQFAEASLQNVRLEGDEEAQPHIAQAGDAVARGDIGAIQEHMQLSQAELAEARAELSSAPTAAIEIDRPASILGSAMQITPDDAPPRFRDQVSDYFRILNEEL